MGKNKEKNGGKIVKAWVYEGNGACIFPNTCKTEMTNGGKPALSKAPQGVM